MFGIIKKIIFLGVLGLLAYAIFADDGVKNIKKYARDIKSLITQNKDEEVKDQSVKEKEEIKKKTWLNVDKDVPEEFDSGVRPEGKLKTQIKKIKNKAGGGDYGYQN